jgi:hypothetical protein
MFSRQAIKKTLRDIRGYGLRTVPPLNIVVDESFGGIRLNMVIPHIRTDRIFGGVSTALRFCDSIAKHFSAVRLIILWDKPKDIDASMWEGWSLATQESKAKRQIAFLTHGDGKIEVNGNDRFIATHWSTAYFVISVRTHLAKHKNNYDSKFVYLIQDFEPGFYPWSSDYLLADSTYLSDKNVVAVFNSGLLRDFFALRGYQFDKVFSFEARMHPVLSKYHLEANKENKKRVLLVYGRPGTPRNAFDMIVDSLRLWAHEYKLASSWEIVSVGESHPTIFLTKALSIKSRGKVSLEEYATLLLTTSVGISLMVSPHPSYPPLEMASFGVQVVTNRFATKNLSDISKNIASLFIVTPVTLAEELRRKCLVFDEGMFEPEFTSLFNTHENEFPFADDIVESLLSQ